MIKLLSKRVGFVAAITGAAIIGGAATAFVSAAIPSSADGKIYGCYKNNASLVDAKGALRLIDSQTNQNCNTNETAINWQANGSEASQVAYTRIYADNGGQEGVPLSAVVDTERTKNITDVQFKRVPDEDGNLVSGYCITVSFEPKNIQATPYMPLGLSEDQGIIALKSSASGWNDVSVGLRPDPSEICQDVPSANAFVGTDQAWIRWYIRLDS